MPQIPQKPLQDFTEHHLNRDRLHQYLLWHDKAFPLDPRLRIPDTKKNRNFITEQRRINEFRARYRKETEPGPGGYHPNVPEINPDVLQTVLGVLATTVQNSPPLLPPHLKNAQADRVAWLKLWGQSQVSKRKTLYGSQTPAPPWSKAQNCAKNYGVWLVNGEMKVTPFHCHKRHCPICQEQRTMRLRNRFREALASWTAPKHLSFTLRSCNDDLEDQLKRLVTCFRNLRRTKLWRNRTPYGMWMIEVTFNTKTGLWHPHLHVIANMPFCPKENLQAEWRKITGDSWNCHISAVKGDLEKELTKYIAKTSSIYFAPVDPYRLDGALKNKRFVQPFGRWPDQPDGDPVEAVWMGTLTDVLRKAAQNKEGYENIMSLLVKNYPRELYQTLLRFRPLEIPTSLS